MSQLELPSLSDGELSWTFVEFGKSRIKSWSEHKSDSESELDSELKPKLVPPELYQWLMRDVNQYFVEHTRV
jgi:hypothetical protein